MASRGGQLENTNAAKGHSWRYAVERALARAGAIDGARNAFRKGLDKAADMFVMACHAGDPWALKELADRLDGKPAQVIQGPDGEAPKLIPIVFVDALERPEGPDLKLIEGKAE